MTLAMGIADTAFMVDKLAADTPPLQYLRELLVNEKQAIERRWAAGDHVAGSIVIEPDWQHFKKANVYKFSVTGNGDGMYPGDMVEYLNHLAVQGASKNQGITGNFGLGARITCLSRNPVGVVYNSWRDGVGHRIWLHRDEEAKVYGLMEFRRPDNSPTYTPRVKDDAKPPVIDGSGTKVTLLGADRDKNTYLPPDDYPGKPNATWIQGYLNGRFWKFPDRLTVKVRKLTLKESEWPKSREECEKNDKFGFETIYGAKHILESQAKPNVRGQEKGWRGRFGTVVGEIANYHWFVFDDPAEVNRLLSARSPQLRTNQLAVIFQDEVYTVRQNANRLLTRFGIRLSADNVVIYIEPRVSTGIELRSDTARSRLLINGQDVDDLDKWSEWGDDFKARMPEEIRAKEDELWEAVAPQGDDPTMEKAKKRALEMLELLRPPRFRPNPNGKFRAKSQAPGGGEQETGDSFIDYPVSDSSNSSKRQRRRNSRNVDDLMADLDLDGEPATEVDDRLDCPDPLWIKATEESQSWLEDRAAGFSDDPLTDNVLTINENYRNFQSLVEFFEEKINADNNPVVSQSIVKHCKEWYASQLLEGVVAVRASVDSGRSNREFIKNALSPEGLSAMSAPRYHTMNQIKRALGQEGYRVG